MIQLLVEHEANPNIKTHLNTTPLHLAAEQGLTGIVQSFLNHGADVDAICSNGYTPLVLALNGNHFKTAELLLKETKRCAG